MKLSKAIGLGVCLVVSMMLVVGPMAGCGGSKSTGDQTVKTTTKGQELQDLDAAYKKGIISEKEYNEQKKKILKAK